MSLSTHCSDRTVAAVYRRRPERTVLYRVVQENLETWLARREAVDAEGGGVPRSVEGELRRYLECGILAHGFARARCAECGYDFVVAATTKDCGSTVGDQLTTETVGRPHSRINFCSHVSEPGVGDEIRQSIGPAIRGCRPSPRPGPPGEGPR